MKRALALSFSFIGTVIGAGFATGKEISLFFSSCSPVTVIFAGIFLGFFCYVILTVSSRFGNIFSSFGFLKTPITAFVLFSNFCVLCATIAGGETCFNSLTGINGGGVLVAFIALCAALLGISFIKKINTVLVPVIIVVVLIVFFSCKGISSGGKTSVVISFAYSSMNIVTGGFFLGMKSSELSEKEKIICSVTSGVILTSLLLCVYFSVKNVSAEMPFIQKADELGFGFIGNVVLLLALVTTAVGTLAVCSGNKKRNAVITVFSALAASLFGFDKIVTTVYPLVGAVGGAITVCSLIIFILTSNPKFSRYYNLLFRPNGSLIHRRSKRGNSVDTTSSPPVS